MHKETHTTMLHPYDLPTVRVSRDAYLTRLEWVTNNPTLWMQDEPFMGKYPVYHGVETVSGEQTIVLDAEEAVIVLSVEHEGYVMQPRDSYPLSPFMLWGEDGDALDRMYEREEYEEWDFHERCMYECPNAETGRVEGHYEQMLRDMSEEERETLAEYKHEVQPNWMTW